MTYCVAMLLEEGIVVAADSRTNAGVDHVNTFRKMRVFERPEERVLVLASAGNLAITQAVVNVLAEQSQTEGEKTLWNAPTLFAAARVIGDAIRQVYHEDGPTLKEFQIDFNASFLLAGQIRGEKPRLFNIYSAGNFIEASPETPYFQIGESKYGKPIIDRVINYHSSLKDGAKCALLSMDSTLKSNVSVGLPIDLLMYEKDSLRVTKRAEIDNDNTYFNTIRRVWGEGLRSTFANVPGMDWESDTTK